MPPGKFRHLGRDGAGADFPLTPALSPSAGERGNRRQSVGEPGDLSMFGEARVGLPLPRRGGEGRGEGEAALPSSRPFDVTIALCRYG